MIEVGAGEGNQTLVCLRPHIAVPGSAVPFTGSIFQPIKLVIARGGDRRDALIAN